MNYMNKKNSRKTNKRSLATLLYRKYFSPLSLISGKTKLARLCLYVVL